MTTITSLLVHSLMYVFMFVTQSQSKRKSDVIASIAVKFCPCMKYCKNTEQFSYDGKLYRNDATVFCEREGFYQPQNAESQTVLCCSDCSCQDDCWKTANCCPDKDNIKEEPTPRCKSPVVKPFQSDPHRNLGYFVIDECPSIEENTTLIDRCLAKEKTEIIDYIWVSDLKAGLTYKNEFCAACHNVTEYVYWQLNPDCKAEYFTADTILNEFLMSNGCRLKLETPVDVSFQFCVIPDYTRCNQTGAWVNYDAEIERACDAYHYVYFVEGRTFYHQTDNREVTEIDSYKNVYCYRCNKGPTKRADPMCHLGDGFGLLYIEDFSTLIEYKGYHSKQAEVGQSPQSACKEDEVMDKFVGICRALKCPYGTKPVNETCEQIFEEIMNLPVNIRFGLMVAWTNTNYTFNDDEERLDKLGNTIFREVTDGQNSLEIPGCRLCSYKIDMVSTVGETDVEHASESVSEPQFIYETLVFTTESCPLEYMYNHVSDSSDRQLFVHSEAEEAMYLVISLLGDYTKELNMKKTLFNGRIPDCMTESAYTIRNVRFCGMVSIRFSDFENYLTESNMDLIESLFTENQTKSNEEIDICLDDYYQTMSLVKLKSGASADISSHLAGSTYMFLLWVLSLN